MPKKLNYYQIYWRDSLGGYSLEKIVNFNAKVHECVEIFTSRHDAVDTAMRLRKEGHHVQFMEMDLQDAPEMKTTNPNSYAENHREIDARECNRPYGGPNNSYGYW